MFWPDAEHPVITGTSRKLGSGGNGFEFIVGDIGRQTIRIARR
jgi:hypothetical protein